MEIKVLRHADILRCPFFIMVPEHYHDNGYCRCDDPKHKEMQAWGYRWNGEAWIGLEEFRKING